MKVPSAGGEYLQAPAARARHRRLLRRGAGAREGDRALPSAASYGQFVNGAERERIVVQLVVAAACDRAGVIGVARDLPARATLSALESGKGSFCARRAVARCLAVGFTVIAHAHRREFPAEPTAGPIEIDRCRSSSPVAWSSASPAYVLAARAFRRGSLQRRLIRAVTWAAWIAVILHFTGLLPAVLSALDAHQRHRSARIRGHACWTSCQAAARSSSR